MNLPQDGTASGTQGGWPQTQIDAIVSGADMRDFYNKTTGSNWRNSSGYLLDYKVNYLLTGVNVTAY